MREKGWLAALWMGCSLSALCVQVHLEKVLLCDPRILGYRKKEGKSCLEYRKYE